MTADSVDQPAQWFDGARLTLARHLAGMSKLELGHRLSMTSMAVIVWESGRSEPKAESLAALSTALQVESSFFRTPARSIATTMSGAVVFRRPRSLSQCQRHQAWAYTKVVADVINIVAHHTDLPEPDVLSVPGGGIAGSVEPEHAARMLREHWNLGSDPIPHLVRQMESHGVVVVFAPTVMTPVDAYSFVGPARPMVVLNPSTVDPYRRRFELARELGHLVMHGDAVATPGVLEEEADRFATELLAPAERVIEMLPTTMQSGGWFQLGMLMERWGMAPEQFLWQARNLEQLKPATYRNAQLLMQKYRSRQPWLESGAEGVSLLAAAIRRLAEEGIDVSWLAEQCGVPSALFEMVVATHPLQAKHNGAPPSFVNHRGMPPSLFAANEHVSGTSRKTHQPA